LKTTGRWKWEWVVGGASERRFDEVAVRGRWALTWSAT
jgi:hypothetical protein